MGRRELRRELDKLNWTELILPSFHSVSHRQHVFSPSTTETHTNNSQSCKTCYNAWSRHASKNVLEPVGTSWIGANSLVWHRAKIPIWKPDPRCKKVWNNGSRDSRLKNWYMHKYVLYKKGTNRSNNPRWYDWYLGLQSTYTSLIVNGMNEWRSHTNTT